MAYTRMYHVRTVAIGFMTDTMGRMHFDVATALNKQKIAGQAGNDGMTKPAMRSCLT